MSTPENRAPYLVALLGFAGFEQQALDAYLKLARARSPAYAPCEAIEGAQFVIANGDRSSVLDLLAAAQRIGDTVLVGRSAIPGVAAHLPRPIDPAELFRALDDAVHHRSLAATAAHANPRNVTMAEIAAALAPNDHPPQAAFFAPTALRPSPVDAMPTRSLAARDDVPPPIIGPEHGRPNGVAAWHAERSATAAPETPHGTPLHALVVGGDGSKLLPLLEALNVTATVVAKAHHAFAMLDSFAFDVVAIEVDLGERSDLDGLRVCQAIRGQQRPPGEVCPPILVTSARPSPLEEARASLAGARGYLGGPLLERDLERALIEAGVRVTPVTSSPISLRA